MALKPMEPPPPPSGEHVNGSMTPISSTIDQSAMPLTALALKVVSHGERLDAFRNEFYVRLDALQKALELQAAEYARRLEILNHAHDREIERQQTYLPRESFRMSLSGWESWRVGLERTIAEIVVEKANWRTNFEAKFAEHVLSSQIMFVGKETFQEFTSTINAWRGKTEDSMQQNRLNQLAMYVQREVYDKSESDDRTWKTGAEKRLNEMAGLRERIEGQDKRISVMEMAESVSTGREAITKILWGIAASVLVSLVVALILHFSK